MAVSVAATMFTVVTSDQYILGQWISIRKTNCAILHLNNQGLIDATIHLLTTWARLFRVHLRPRWWLVQIVLDLNNLKRKSLGL